MNVDVRDNILFQATVLGARVRMSSTFSVPNSNQVIMTPWDVEDYDSDNMHAAGGYALNVNTVGKYLICGSVLWPSNAGNLNQRQIYLYRARGGVDTQLAKVYDRGISATSSVVQFLESVDDAQINDQYRMEIFHDQGAAQVIPVFNSTFLLAHRIGA
jgi:hypothetical protein